MFKINIGELKNKITFISYKNIIDDDGFEQLEEIEEYKCFAKIQSLYGRELYSAMSVGQENNVKFIVRYSNKIKNIGQNIKFNGQIFDVVNIENVDFSNRWLIITANAKEEDIYE